MCPSCLFLGFHLTKIIEKEIHTINTIDVTLSILPIFLDLEEENKVKKKCPTGLEARFLCV